jgi:hypothetical protein
MPLAVHRTEVVRLGALLGLAEPEVQALAEALTGMSWGNCGVPELDAVVEELRHVARIMAAQDARPVARHPDGGALKCSE